MSSIESPELLDTLKNEAKHSQPGILRKITNFESYIGHTVINISNTTLQENQIRALEKRTHILSNTRTPEKSQIWLDFKEFHRRLELMEFFSRDNYDQPDTNISQSIIDFMNQNANDTETEITNEDSLNKEIQSKFKNKSNWRPNPPNKTLDIFQRSIKQEILKYKFKHKKHSNSNSTFMTLNLCQNDRLQGATS